MRSSFARVASLTVPALLLGALPAAAAPCPTRASWPTSDWPTNLVQNKTAEIKALEDFAFTLQGEDRERLGFRSNGMVIIKGGTVIYEKYARGFDANKKQLSWSVAKSISSALIGVAVQTGALSLDDSICTHLTRFSGGVCDIKVKHVITFGSGIQWQEEYENSSYQVSSVLAMLFGVGHRDQVKHVLTHRQAVAPGSRFAYSTGEAHVLATIAKAALEKKHGADAFWTQLFDRIGMKATFEHDAAGNPLGGSFVYATTRDFAKFGYLFLNDGCWEDQRILPEGWVASSSTINDTFKSSRGECPEVMTTSSEYHLPCETTPSGYMWWLNQPPAAGESKPWKDIPDDTYAALGHWGQRIIVVPSADVVIVRNGDDRKGSIDVNELTKLALEVAK